MVKFKNSPISSKLKLSYEGIDMPLQKADISILPFGPACIKIEGIITEEIYNLIFAEPLEYKVEEEVQE